MRNSFSWAIFLSVEKRVGCVAQLVGRLSSREPWVPSSAPCQQELSETEASLKFLNLFKEKEGGGHP